MKTRMTIVAMVAAMLCGCRAPSAISSARELDGHALSAADETSAASDASTRPAAIMQTSDPASASSLPVSEQLARAEQAIRAQQLVVARSQLQSILIQHPHHPRTHHLLAVIADLDGRFGDAEEHYLAALAGDPHNAKIVGDLGYSYYLQSRFAESEQFLQHAIEIDPQYGRAARNLAQLYSDRGEAARAELLLRSILPEAEAETALAELRRQPPGDPSLFSNLLSGRDPEPTGAELTRQIREEMDAAARAARVLRRRQHEVQEAGRTAAREIPEPSPPSGYGGTVTINPWSRQLSAIDASGTQSPPSTLVVGPAVRPAANGAVRETVGMPATDRLPAINPIRNVGGQAHPGASNTVETAIGMRTMPAEDRQPDPAGRRWPPATWTPLMDDPGSTGQPPTYDAPASQPPPYHHGRIHQVSATVNPWESDVQHAIGRDADPSVERAHFERDPDQAPAEDVIQPVSVQAANSPAVLPAWDSRTSAGSQAATPRSAPGTDSVNGSQYPPAYRHLPGDPDRPSGTPVISSSGGPPDPYQSARQSYNNTMNARAGSTYARSPANRPRSPGSASMSRSWEVPAYPRRPTGDAAPPVAPESGTPWPSHTTTAAPASSGWTQESPNTSASSTDAESPQSGPGVVEPEPYRGGRPSSGYERYTVPGSAQQTTRRY